MQTNINERYNQAFYENQVAGSSSSASAILESLFEHYQPHSMLDIGCGRGTWLASAEKLGVSILHGIDGPWNKASDLLSKKIAFNPVDMEGEIPINQRYDLSISVEVAEHLSKRRAIDFVNTLCKGADVVLFGAAVICQGGENHINEQRQSYWLELFGDKGFRCFDIIRPKVWNDPRVMPWYRQNTLVYVNKTRDDLINKFTDVENSPIIDIIHPEMFENRVKYYRDMLNNPSARICAGILKSFLSSKIGFKSRRTPTSI